jgi:hypothetical protein
LEYTLKDRSRKNIKKWREAIEQAENPEDPRWFALQDIYDDLSGDAHLSSVLDVRRATTLNHRFYVTDERGGELEEQTGLLDRKWFYDFMEHCLNAIFRKVSVLQFYTHATLIGTEEVTFDIIPARNICPQKKRVYLEISGDKFIDYSAVPNVIEILHGSTFGLLNDVVPNVVWKRNSIQSWAEFSERFGMPLTIIKTGNRNEIDKINKQAKLIGEAGAGIFPIGTEIEVIDSAKKGDPYNTYLRQMEAHDDQISKRIVGGTMITDNGASRSQSEVMERTLDDKIGIADKRFVRFVVNDKLFPVLQNLGLPFDNTKMRFQFDETESLSLKDQWDIVNSAALRYELDTEWVAKTFNIPILKEREPDAAGGGLSGNFR